MLPNGKDCEDIDECQTDSPSCSHYCRNTVGGFRCTCPPGTFLGSDEQTCEGCSIDNGGCQQVCVTVPGDQGFYCLCHGNFELVQKTRCKAKGPQPYLLFANDNDIQQLNFDGTGYDMIKFNLNGSYALDVHYERGKVYYVTQAPTSIYKELHELDLSNDSVNLVLSNDQYLHNPFQIAVDWINNNLYWTDMDLHSIMRVGLDGTNPTEVIKGGSPRGIAVDPHENKLYWTDLYGLDAGSHPAVYVSNLDGSDAQEFYSGGLYLPYAVTIDYIDNKLYWGDAGIERIWYADLDGSNVKVLDNNSSVGLLHGLSQFDEHVWWTDKRAYALRRARKQVAAAVEDLKITAFDGFRNLFSIQVVHPYRQPGRGFHICTTNKGGCSHLCQAIADSYECACPEGFFLGSDKLTCIEDSTTSTPTQSSCPTNCSGNFKGISDIPTFQIPLHQYGLLNSSESLIQYDGHDVVNCASLKGVYKLECNWTDVPRNVVYVDGTSVRGQHIEDLSTWRDIEDKLIRLTVECNVSAGGQMTIEQFCLLFKVTLLAGLPVSHLPTPSPDPCIFDNGGCSDTCNSTGSESGSAASICSCPI